MAKAFLLYDMNPATQRSLAESFVKGFKDVLYRDVSGLSFYDISEAARTLESSGYHTVLFVRESGLPKTLTSDYIREQTLYGLLRSRFGNQLHVVTKLSEMRTIVEADDPKVKEPTEVDRLKVKQKREEIMLKKRDAEEMLQAKERELEKKEREDTAKIEQGEKKQDRG